MYFIKVYVSIMGHSIKGTPMQWVLMWAWTHILHAETVQNLILSCIEFIFGDRNIYLYLRSFLNTELRQVIEIHPPERQQPVLLHYTVNTMAADVIVIEGARASAAMVLT